MFLMNFHLVDSLLALSVGIVTSAILVQEGIEVVFSWVLLAAHEHHVFEKVCKTLQMLRLMEAPNSNAESGCCHLVLLSIEGLAFRLRRMARFRVAVSFHLRAGTTGVFIIASALVGRTFVGKRQERIWRI
uniref:Putative secreted protein n=1 Tax=Ixodes ricinus TaxID=34613 RepID=A0A6B0UR02_IXORI